MSVVEKVKTSVYLNRQAKEGAQKVLKKYGLNLSDAVNIFLSIIAKTEKLPFEFHVPNKVTKQVLEEVLEGKGLKEVTVKEILDEIKEAQAIYQGSEEGKDY